MKHWTKLDHITFLLMIIPILTLLITPNTVFVLILTIILLILWSIALIYDLYEAVKKNSVNKSA